MIATAPMPDNEHKNKRELSSKRRLLQILGILKRHHLSKGVDPIKLREIIEELGPTFVKIGQIMSTRQDMFSERYCKELEKLRDDVAPLHYEEVKQVIESEFGCDIEDVFPNFQKEPLGSASIAQVHHATLRDGRNIVVKVQRPHIYEMMERDIALVRRASSILKLSEILGSVVDINIVLDEFWAAAKQEMDFLIEINNAVEFKKRNAEYVYIATPDIYREYSTTKVLVMEYIEGYSSNQLEQLNACGYDVSEIAAKLADNYIKQIIDDGYFHADPHQGNIRIRDGKIVWIDFGMMGVLSNQDKEWMRKGIQSMVESDTGKLVDVVLNLGVHNGKIDYTLLYNDMESLMNKYLTMDLVDINLGLAIQEIFSIAHHHSISMPKGISMLARGLVTMESTLMELDPKTNIIRIAAAHMSGNLLKDFDLKKDGKAIGRKIIEATSKGMELPVQLSDVLRMAMKGHLKINLEVMDSLQPLSLVDQMVNKLVVCIGAAALLIGSSLICTTKMEPTIFGIPLLGFIGYMCAVILGVWMLFHTHIDK